MKSDKNRDGSAEPESLPVRGAWVEIRCLKGCPYAIMSLPVRGAWVEINSRGTKSKGEKGRSPCGERGLK